MNELIEVKVSNGKEVVSARELYLGLGLSKSQWSRWSNLNIKGNEFFNEGYDYVGVLLEVEGNEVQDYAITLEFAKHIAMMAKTDKSHQYRNYFLVCEQKAMQLPKLSKELQAIFVLDRKQQALEEELKNFKQDIPLFNIECDELQKLVKKIGVKMLGGKNSRAYKDNSLRARVYSDIQREIKRQFGTESYKALKRSQLEKAKEIVNNYKLPLLLEGRVIVLNNQLEVNYDNITMS